MGLPMLGIRRVRIARRSRFEALRGLYIHCYNEKNPHTRGLRLTTCERHWTHSLNSHHVQVNRPIRVNMLNKLGVSIFVCVVFV